MNQIRVALFTGNYNHIKDGVSLTLNRWVRFLLDQGVEVVVFGPSVDQPEVDHAGELVVLPSVPVPFSNRGEYRISLGLSTKAESRLADFNPNIIHIATPDIAGLKALKWAHRNNVQVVGSYHTHFSSYLEYYGAASLEFLAWRYLSWFYSACKHVYVPSQSMIDELISHGFNTDMRIWARGVDTDLFSPQQRNIEWRNKHGFKPDDVIVTFVSRLVWEKELNTFEKSINHLSGKYENMKAMIVGDGPAKEDLKKLMPNAYFTGFLNGDELASAYANSDIFFFPSHTETFGNVTLEAMSAGLPCLVADATGSRSLVDHDENGFLCEPQNIREFISMLDCLMADEHLRGIMGEKSRRMSKNYTWDIINQTLLDSYIEVLASSKPKSIY